MLGTYLHILSIQIDFPVLSFLVMGPDFKSSIEQYESVSDDDFSLEEAKTSYLIP